MALLDFIERLKKGVQYSRSEVNEYRLNACTSRPDNQKKNRDTLHVNGNQTRKFLQNAYKTPTKYLQNAYKLLTKYIQLHFFLNLPSSRSVHINSVHINRSPTLLTEGVFVAAHVDRATRGQMGKK